MTESDFQACSPSDASSGDTAGRAPSVLVYGFIAIVLTLLAGVSAGDWPLGHAAAHISPRLQVNTLAGRVPERPQRSVYRYSVIPGGAYSRQEMTDAIARDPLIAKHYRALSLGALRAETVEQPRMVYVSYRRNGAIYWTKQRVTLSKGETILTDGVTEVRGRCGNCISVAPMMPVAENGPDTVEMDGLVAGFSEGLEAIEQPAPRTFVGEAFPLNTAMALLFEGAALGAVNDFDSAGSPLVGAFSTPFPGGVLGSASAANGGALSAPGGGQGLTATVVPPVLVPLPPGFTPPTGGDSTNDGGTPTVPILTSADSGSSPGPPSNPDIAPQTPAASTVPEPGSFFLIGTGVVGLLRRLRVS